MVKKAVKKTKVKAKSSSKKTKESSGKTKNKFKKIHQNVKKTFIGRWISNLRHEHKVIFGAILIVLLFIFIFFGARLYLFFNFILGNDTIVKLDANQQDFFLVNSQTGEVQFDMYVSTNLFCEASCEYLFEDLSNGYILDKNNFSAKIANPNRVKYSLVAPTIGEGQKLYNFAVSCKSRQTTFCRTSEKPRKRNLLVALNYKLSPEQKEFKERANNSLKDLIVKTDNLHRVKDENKKMFNVLEDVVEVDKLLKDNLSSIEDQLDTLLINWKKYNYENVLEQDLLEEINHTEKIIFSENEKLIGMFRKYDNLTRETKELRKEIDALIEINGISLDDNFRIKSLIKSFNEFMENVNETFDLNSTIKKIKPINDLANYTFTHLNITSNEEYNYTNLSVNTLKEIIRPVLMDYSSGRFIQAEEQICCYHNDCEICCNESCQNDPSKYPIILLHGHSFNSAISAESSLGDLDSIKFALSKDGVVDGGYVILKNLKETGTFARTNKRIVFATSYYFDIFQNKEKSIVLPTKGDSLDTYALRLNDIIENVKTMTKRDKVVIIAHSMGGLVSRRYMQIYGDDNVDQLIMIGTPNHGVDGYILSGCSVLGSKNHCRDMNKDSLFLNKLNYGKKPTINSSVIIGIGCENDGEVSDGVVKNQSAFLPWADNYYVKGNCSGVDVLHISMLDTDVHPETYEIIKKKLKLE